MLFVFCIYFSADFVYSQNAPLEVTPDASFSKDDEKAILDLQKEDVDKDEKKENKNTSKKISKDEIFDGKNFFENNSFLDSILFKNSELEILYSTLNSYRENGVIEQNNASSVAPEKTLNNLNNTNDLTEEIASSAKNQAVDELSVLKELEAISFYLKSILNSEEDNNWTIWFNEIKRRSTEKGKISNYKGLKILEVTGKSVAFSFKDKNLEIINPDYKSKFLATNDSEWDYKSKNGRVFINSKKSKIKFFLNVNETFVMDGLKIKQGYFAPSMVKNPYYVDPTTIKDNQNISNSGLSNAPSQIPEDSIMQRNRNPLNSLPGSVNNRLPIPTR
ncbi:MAG: hypothetical protein SFT90_08265 [Rickettsiales bacterium]|nr:hypothetical protein [Rickettsiales bacterium]